MHTKTEHSFFCSSFGIVKIRVKHFSLRLKYLRRCGMKKLIPETVQPPLGRSLCWRCDCVCSGVCTHRTSPSDNAGKFSLWGLPHRQLKGVAGVTLGHLGRCDFEVWWRYGAGGVQARVSLICRNAWRTERPAVRWCGWRAEQVEGRKEALGWGC